MPVGARTAASEDVSAYDSAARAPHRRASEEDTAAPHPAVVAVAPPSVEDTYTGIESELRGTLPRRVRYTGSSLVARRLVWNAALAVGALLCFLSTRDLGQWRALAARGVPEMAFVTQKGGDSGRDDAKSRRIRYAFNVGDGEETITGKTRLSREQARALRVGDRIMITRLPDQPGVHRAGTVNAARVAENTNRWAITWGIGAALMALLIGSTEAYLANRRRLLRCGVAVPAVVVDRRTTESEGTVAHLLTYAFTDSAGGERKGTVSVSAAYADAHPVGSRLTALYDPAAPANHAAYVALTQAQVEGAPTRPV